MIAMSHLDVLTRVSASVPAACFRMYAFMFLMHPSGWWVKKKKKSKCVIKQMSS